MKLAKKTLSVAVASILMLSMAACSGGNGGQSASSGAASSIPAASASASQQTPTETDENDAFGGWQPTHDYSERLNINLTNVGTIEGYDYASGDGYAQYYADLFNMDLDVTGTTYDNWNERLRVWINSGDMPEVAVINYTASTHADFVNYVDQDLLKRLPDDWKTKWPNVAKAYEVSSLGPQAEKVFEGTYFIPRPRFNENLPGDPLPDHLSLYMRKDWMEAVGFEVKTTYTVSEVMEYLRLIKEKDPGGLGGKMIPLVGNPAYSTRLFVSSNSTHYNNFYQDTDGSFKWGPASEDTLAGLKLFQQAFSEGLLDPEFYNYKIDEDIELLAIQGIAGACFQPAPTGAINNWRTRFTDSTGLDRNFVHVATVLGEDGNYHQEDLINFWGVIAFNPDISDAKFERMMDILDFNATPLGVATTNLGIPEVDWQIDANGEYVSLLPAGQLLSGNTGKYPSVGYTIGVSILFDDFAFNNPNIPKVDRELSRTLYDERCKIATPQSFEKVNWDLYTYSSPSKSKVSFDYGVEYSSLVTMQGDLEANWKSWVDSKMSIVQPVLDELNG